MQCCTNTPLAARGQRQETPDRENSGTLPEKYKRLGCSSVVEHFPSMHGDLGLILSIAKTEIKMI